MTSVDLNYIQFYQSSIKTSLPRERVSKAFNANVSVVVEERKPFKVSEPSNEWDQRLWCDDAIEFVNMIDSPRREQFRHFRESVSDLREIEADARGKYFSRSLTKGS